MSSNTRAVTSACGAGTAGTVTFCLIGTGTGMHYGVPVPNPYPFPKLDLNPDLTQNVKKVKKSKMIGPFSGKKNKLLLTLKRFSAILSFLENSAEHCLDPEPEPDRSRNQNQNFSELGTGTAIKHFGSNNTGCYIYTSTILIMSWK